MITGSMNQNFSRTVSTSGSGSSAAQFTSIVSAPSGKSIVSFDKALSQHLQSGGTGNVFYDPVMHYDLSSMKDKFEVVNEEAGIYKKDGVLYAKKDLGDSTVLQPIGIQKNAEDKYEAVGTSTDLPKEQSDALEGILAALKETEGDLEKAIEQVKEKESTQKDQSRSSEPDGETATPATDAGTTHSGPK